MTATGLLLGWGTGGGAFEWDGSQLGGTISGEHGIGHKRKKFMPLVCSEAHIEMMRAVKRALNPNNILNPGKIFDI